MASFQKHKAKNGDISWRAQIFTSGIRDSKSFSSKTEAKLWATQREAEIKGSSPRRLSGPAGIPASPSVSRQTLSDAFDRYSREVSPTKAGRRWEQVRLTKLSRYPLASTPLSELNASHIAAWRDERLKEVSTSSVRREMTLLSNCLEYCRREWLWISANPCKDVKKPSDAPHRTQRVSTDDAQKLLDALGYIRGTTPTNKQQEVAIALLLALETAMRSGEILSLAREHIHLDQSFVHLPKTKNGSTRNVPLSSAAKELIRLMLQIPAQRDRRLFTLKQVSRDVLFRRAKVKAGLEHINFHDSRREATTKLSERFTPLELARITGHKKLDMLLVYYEQTAAQLAQKLD